MPRGSPELSRNDTSIKQNPTLVVNNENIQALNASSTYLSELNMLANTMHIPILGQFLKRLKDTNPLSHDEREKYITEFSQVIKDFIANKNVSQIRAKTAKEKLEKTLDNNNPYIESVIISPILDSLKQFETLEEIKKVTKKAYENYESKVEAQISNDGERGDRIYVRREGVTVEVRPNELTKENFPELSPKQIKAIKRYVPQGFYAADIHTFVSDETKKNEKSEAQITPGIQMQEPEKAKLYKKDVSPKIFVNIEGGKVELYSVSAKGFLTTSAQATVKDSYHGEPHSVAVLSMDLSNLKGEKFQAGATDKEVPIEFSMQLIGQGRDFTRRYDFPEAFSKNIGTKDITPLYEKITSCALEAKKLQDLKPLPDNDPRAIVLASDKKVEKAFAKLKNPVEDLKRAIDHQIATLNRDSNPKEYFNTYERRINSITGLSKKDKKTVVSYLEERVLGKDRPLVERDKPLVVEQKQPGRLERASSFLGKLNNLRTSAGLSSPPGRGQ